MAGSTPRGVGRIVGESFGASPACTCPAYVVFCVTYGRMWCAGMCKARNKATLARVLFCVCCPGSGPVLQMAARFGTGRESCKV